MRDEQMIVNFSSEDAAFLRQQVEKKGDDASADEVVADAMRLLKEREVRLSRLKAEVQAARDDPRSYTIEEVEERLRKRFREKAANA